MRSATVLRRLAVHEVRAPRSLALWVLRRRDGVRTARYAAKYTEPQTAMLYGFVFVAIVETVALAVLIPWPLVHAITLFIDVYGVVQLIGFHAACVTRPHVVEADGSLRIRYGALFDLRIPAEQIVRAGVDRRYPDGSRGTARDDGTLELPVGGQTTVTVRLAAPVTFVRPLGRVGTAHTVRFNADDPRALVAALRPAPERTAPSPSPVPPG
ncbi:hypothetical protein ACFWU3_21305 [Streptomyces sp. NPDC058685]|uniref:hypothetical protein n=1 Tax=Streptomyces sp. NPDC058685 TaxID=3346598 RepID=UPI003655C5E4